MQFSEEAPGLLVPDGSGGWIGYWDSDSAITSWVSAALSDSRGWGQASPGITFIQSSTAMPRVVFHEVTTIPGDANAIGTTYWDSYDGQTMQVDLEAAYEGNMDLVNHEAAHAFFFAQHSPEGSDSIMEPNEDPGEEWPSATDIAQLEAWLSGAEISSVFWFPGDLETYVTRWPVPSGRVARATASVIRGAYATLQPVYSTSYDDLMAGNYQRFTPGIDCYKTGVYASRWRAVPPGDLYVGIAAKVDAESDIADLIVGLAEVQIRRA